MFEIFVIVASFSFQISGAIILLLWSLGKCDNKIKKMCVNRGNPYWLDMDGNATVSKTDLQANAKTVYLNISAFANILLGYTCAIFVEDTYLSAWVVFGLVIIATIVVLCFDYLLTNWIAKVKYPCDQKVKVDE